jgi:hypothetical protein
MSLVVTGVVMAVSSAVVSRSLKATGASLIGRMVIDIVAVEAVPVESTTRSRRLSSPLKSWIGT